ncbi:uncharacterized protein N0V89_005681 [Didymosphaeria variabile]|uniref:Uncharacterized protein n=1 Tax=Didymosphaeria variabile TaxID=1932322 RepID=A0A9W9CBQ4_9PLEO|nr:uncharacterized protein N0V89_005681 [Didymosphaeria variabile]KAJ4353949.1 hypothetical protein N0V89_005681 [Didymosphaeria variabile]
MATRRGRRKAPEKLTAAANQQQAPVKLTDLPPELFALCMHNLVSDIGSAAAVKYRLVCKAFSNAIQNDIIGVQRIAHVFQPLTEAQKLRLLIRHGGAMHANKRGIAANAVTKLARQMMGELLIAECIDPDDIGKEHLLAICTGLIAGSRHLRNDKWKEIVGDVQERPGVGLEDGHVIADSSRICHKVPPVVIQDQRLWTSIAAIGDLKMFEKMVPITADVFVGHEPYLQSAFLTAAGTGRTSIVEYIVERSLARIRHLPGYTPQILAHRFTIGVQVSVRQRQFAIAAIICRFIFERLAVHESIMDPDSLGNDVLRGALKIISRDEHVEECHLTFLCSVLEAIHGVRVKRSNMERFNVLPQELIVHMLPQSDHQFDQIYEEASRSYIRAVLKDAFVDIYDIRWFRALRIAIDHHRFDLACIWINHAEFLKSERNRTMLMSRRVDRGCLAGVKFLVQHGVRPDQYCPAASVVDQTALGKAIRKLKDSHIRTEPAKRFEDVALYLCLEMQSSNANRLDDDHVPANDDDAEVLLKMLRRLPRVEGSWLFERIRENDDIADLARNYRGLDVFSDEEPAEESY